MEWKGKKRKKENTRSREIWKKMRRIGNEK